eukprot:g1889.t1
MAQEQAGVGNAVASSPQDAQQEAEPPPPAIPAPRGPPHQRKGQQIEQNSLEHGAPKSHDNSNGGANISNGGAAPAMVTPDEVLALGVLALAGLWPGCWNGIAAIIVHKVERMKMSGVCDIPFQQCARSLVDLLLRNPGDASLAAETWQHLTDAQARLPNELGQVLSLACSLLQRRSWEASEAREKRKRRRTCSSDAVAARAATIPSLPIPCTPAMLTMASDIVREQEEQELEERRKRQRETEASAAPRLLPPSEVLPLLLQQPQPPPRPASASAETAQPQPQPPAPTLASPGATPAPPDQLMPAQPSGEGAAGAAHPVYSMSAGLGGTEAEFPVLLPHSASSAPNAPRPAANWESNGGHQGPQGAELSPQPHPPQDADYPSNLAAAASGSVIAPPDSEAIRVPTS